MTHRAFFAITGGIFAAAALMAVLDAPAEARDRHGNPGVAALEDCIGFNPDRVEVSRENGRWKVVEGNHWMFDFGSDRSARREARRAVRVIRHYDLTESCFVGRPNAEFKYLLAGRAAPRGRVGNEDCIGFNARNLRIRRDGRRWLMTDGRSRMLVFDRAAEAFKALFLVQYYGFTNQCFVGRPNPDFVYWRR